MASNEIARKVGFDIGTTCFKVGSLESHRGCKVNLTLFTKTEQAVKSAEGKIRYWLPVKVHITLDPNTIEQD
ncbi:hypothetical protein [Clostridium estertheticum]|uniref:hypothetical protein n=1 Tax=Clostridium estertheticum TaxID=238834 RepID=UPI001C7CA49A|nr:hypothetical protein [Clostridium estertheticum]MBX4270063.1 hypothetical protein [Clostridium estertheticum]WLC80267.1 hypothetical protein KTC98_02735 [Clostridium estertheticum]